MAIAPASFDEHAALAPPLPAQRPLTGRAPARVTIEGLSVTFGNTRALEDVSIDVRPGEILCLLGPSGSGKSTLLRVVAGITRADRGRIVIDDVEVEGRLGRLEPEKRRVGMVFQDYALFPHLTVSANVAFGLKGHRDAGRLVAELLDRVSLAAHADRYPHMLSGGERQRVALARALAPNPRVLLMDEPFSSLDDRLRDRVRRETLALLRETRTTAIIVTHDPAEAATLGDRIALLRRGRLLQCDTAEGLYARPTTAFAARFFSDVNELCGTSRQGRVDTPLGSFIAPHLLDSTAARICIRPEHLRISRGPNGVRARVIASEFQGEADRVTVAVAGIDTPLSLRVLGRARLVPGTLVCLELDPSDAIVVADDEG